MTRRELETAAGVDSATYTHILRRLRSPTLAYCRKLAAALRGNSGGDVSELDVMGAILASIPAEEQEVAALD